MSKEPEQVFAVAKTIAQALKSHSMIEAAEAEGARITGRFRDGWTFSLSVSASGFDDDDCVEPYPWDE